ncbi:MAG: SDR family NAD(P)-dependent oxidoreductase [Paracoccaceae bacterium]
MSDMAGKVALITGASRGFGRAAPRRRAAGGGAVFALARTQGGLEELDDEIRAAGGAATLVPLDIRDDEGLKRLGAAIHARWGRLDFWLHTAAHATPLSPAEHILPKELDTALATNVRSLSRLVVMLDPLLRLSDNGVAALPVEPEVGHPFGGLWGLTKAAQRALLESWGAEAERRFRVLTLLCPPMPTAWRARFHPGEPRDRLTPTDTVAARLVERFAAAPAGRPLDLR